LKLQTYLSLLEKWNPRINLTANIAWEALEPLFREGVWAAAKYPQDSRAHLDIGSGAGFPAIILRILNPEMKLELVESRGKKGAFLETVAFELGLRGTKVHIRRLEDFLATCAPEKVWDCISWKAIKLVGRDLLSLRDHTSENARFWMFHGREAAVADAGILDSEFVCDTRWSVPGQKESFLSVYRNNVSRET
jgi:16S rRNA (guanine527-N7)-methyltransferase